MLINLGIFPIMGLAMFGVTLQWYNFYFGQVYEY